MTSRANSAVLPHGWRQLRAEDVAAPEKGAIVSGPFGSNIGKRFFVEHGIPVIRGNNLTLGTKTFIDDGFVFITEGKALALRGCEAHPADLIFTAAGTLGQVGRIPDHPRYPKYIISNKQLRLRCNAAISDSRYLYYWFSSPWMRAHIANQNTGASVPLITLRTLRSLPVALPPLVVQRRVADTLSSFDELVDTNLRRIRNLEEMARSLYREWFVDFRFPGRENNAVSSGAQGAIPNG